MRDLIDRQQAIDATWEEPTYTDPINVLTEVRDRIKALPSAQPERKTGKWIIVTDSRGQHAECQYCGEWKYHSKQKFCGKCGAKMEVEE